MTNDTSEARGQTAPKPQFTLSSHTEDCVIKVHHDGRVTLGDHLFPEVGAKKSLGNAAWFCVQAQHNRRPHCRPDDLPEEWHDTYDETPRWPHLLPWVVLATIAVWLVVAFIGFAVGRV